MSVELNSFFLILRNLEGMTGNREKKEVFERGIVKGSKPLEGTLFLLCNFADLLYMKQVVHVQICE